MPKGIKGKTPYEKIMEEFAEYKKKNNEGKQFESGRNRELTLEMFNSLLFWISMARSIEKACNRVRLAETTYYEYAKASPTFKEECEVAKNDVEMNAWANIGEAIRPQPGYKETRVVFDKKLNKEVVVEVDHPQRPGDLDTSRWFINNYSKEPKNSDAVDEGFVASPQNEEQAELLAKVLIKVSDHVKQRNTKQTDS